MAAILSEYLTGGAGNSDPNASLGGARSNTAVSVTALNNIYRDVDSGESASGYTSYRAIAIFNSGDAVAATVTVHMSVPTSSPDTQLDFGLDPTDPIDSVTTIVDEDTAPAGVSFANYTPGSKLTLPDIPNGSFCQLWLRRVVQSGAANTANDQGTIRTEYA